MQLLHGQHAICNIVQTKTTNTSIHDILPLYDQDNVVCLTGNTLRLQKRFFNKKKPFGGLRFFVPERGPLTRGALGWGWG